MARPNIGDVKVDKILSQFSQRYSNDNYIAELILPPLKVKEKSGKYAKYGKENLRVYADQTFRSPGTRANSVDYSVSQGTYICQEHSLEKGIPDEYLMNTDDPYDPKRDAVATIMDNLWVNQEYALAQFMTDTGNLTQNITLTGTDQWSDYANSDPFSDINTAINAVRSATGKIPNSVVMSYGVAQSIKQHPDIREQVKYTSGGQLTDEAFTAFLRGMFHLENVYIGTAIYNSADEGQADSLGDVWNDDFTVFYKNTRPTLLQASFGYTITDTPRSVDSYRENANKQDIVRNSYSYDQSVMDTSLAYLIKNAI